MVQLALFSSASDAWQTPQALFDPWDEAYHFTLDVCATGRKRQMPPVFYPPTGRPSPAVARGLLDEPAVRPNNRVVGQQSAPGKSYRIGSRGGTKTPET